MTTTFYKHNFGFDYFENNLEREIRNRNERSDFSSTTTFTEQEIWYYANSITNGDLTLAREGGSYHGDIQPSTTMLDDKRKIKLIDSGLVNMNKSAY